MAIMKLSNVPELIEFAGTEKIYVNDNGETKQIACDKVVTGSGGERIILDPGNLDSDDGGYIVSLIENGEDVWIKDGQHFSKVTSYDWSVFCGSNSYLILTYITVEGHGAPTLQSRTIGMISSDLSDRLDNISAT